MHACPTILDPNGSDSHGCVIGPPESSPTVSLPACTGLLLLFVVFMIKLSRIALTVLELTLSTRLPSNSRRSACFCLQNAGIKGLHHQRLAVPPYSYVTLSKSHLPHL